MSTALFRSDQIMPADCLQQHFGEIANRLILEPQALLITQDSGHHMVLVTPEIFESLLEECQRLGDSPLT